MEIEPEIMDPQKSRRPASDRMPGKGSMFFFGILALVIGGALLFFMFWIALFFAAMGVISLGVNLIRSWIRGEPSRDPSSGSVKFFISRTPPED